MRISLNFFSSRGGAKPIKIYYCRLGMMLDLCLLLRTVGHFFLFCGIISFPIFSLEVGSTLSNFFTRSVLCFINFPMSWCFVKSLQYEFYLYKGNGFRAEGEMELTMPTPDRWG